MQGKHLGNHLGVGQGIAAQNFVLEL